ncbi:galactose-specific lectin nattectin-like [Polymixia lowei]
MTALCVSLILCALVTLSAAASVNVTVAQRLGLIRSRCEFERHRMADIIGAYAPQCNSDGNFTPQQCWASSGFCWCVDISTGVEIHGTRTPPGTTPVNCESSVNKMTEPEKEEDSYFCPDGWSRYGTRCFIFIDSAKTWLEAEAYCLFEEANLASIHSDNENRFIQALTRGKTHNFPRTWIGGHDAIQNGLWLWSDGSRFDYEYWHTGQGQNGNEQCLEMNFPAEMRWNDFGCTTRLPFVCAKRI